MSRDRNVRRGEIVISVLHMLNLRVNLLIRNIQKRSKELKPGKWSFKSCISVKELTVAVGAQDRLSWHMELLK